MFSRLIPQVWRGLSDRYTVIAINARAFRYFTTVKIARFFRNTLALRTNLRTVMDCLRDVYVLWESYEHYEGSPPVPGLLDLGSTIVRLFPAWESPYKEWLQSEQERMEAAYWCATSLDHWGLVSHHLQIGAGHIIETDDRNVDADFKDVVGSGDIPVKSCPVESVFGTLDNTARSTLNGGTSVLVTKGRAMAQYNHAYATEEEAEKKANKRIRKKKGDSDREEDRSWAMTALYSTPIDVRDRVMEWCRKHISEFKEKEKRERQAAGRAKLARQRKKKMLLNEHGSWR